MLETELPELCQDALGVARNAAHLDVGHGGGLSAPDEIEVSFGVRLTAEAGAVIAKGGVEAHLDVTVRWARPPAETKTVNQADGSLP